MDLVGPVDDAERPDQFIEVRQREVPADAVAATELDGGVDGVLRRPAANTLLIDTSTRASFPAAMASAAARTSARAA